MIKTKSFNFLKDIQDEEEYDILDITKPPRDHPNESYCNICNHRAIKRCKKRKKCFKCPNSHAFRTARQLKDNISFVLKS